MTSSNKRFTHAWDYVVENHSKIRWTRATKAFYDYILYRAFTDEGARPGLKGYERDLFMRLVGADTPALRTEICEKMRKECYPGWEKDALPST